MVGEVIDQMIMITMTGGRNYYQEEFLQNPKMVRKESLFLNKNLNFSNYFWVVKNSHNSNSDILTDTTNII